MIKILNLKVNIIILIKKVQILKYKAMWSDEDYCDMYLQSEWKKDLTYIVENMKNYR